MLPARALIVPVMFTIPSGMRGSRIAGVNTFSMHSTMVVPLFLLRENSTGWQGPIFGW